MERSEGRGVHEGKTMPDFRSPEIDLSDEVQCLLNKKIDACVQDGLNLKSPAHLISHQQPHRPSG